MDLGGFRGRVFHVFLKNKPGDLLAKIAGFLFSACYACHHLCATLFFLFPSGLIARFALMNTKKEVKADPAFALAAGAILFALGLLAWAWRA